MRARRYQRSRLVLHLVLWTSNACSIVVAAQVDDGHGCKFLLVRGPFGADGRQFPENAEGTAETHEAAVNDFVKSGSFARVPDEDVLDELDGFLRDVNALGDEVVAVLDLLVGGVGVFSLEGRHSEVEGVEDDSDAPDIHLEMVASAVQHLGSDVVGSTADSPLALPLELQFGSEAEVSYLNV